MGTISARGIFKDLSAGVVVYLVALPLCLGIALASDAPLASGLLAGIIGGVVVGALSGSHTSVAGPAAGLTGVIVAQLAELGSFSAFLVAVVLAGVIQIGLGLARAGFLANFFPSSVIKGLLAAIGLILILKQVPHVLGHDADIEGEMAFVQPDGENSFTELIAAFFDIQPGATAIGLGSLLILFFWDRLRFTRRGPVPAPLVVVLFGVAVNTLLSRMGNRWVVDGEHLVRVPVVEGGSGLGELLVFPDWSFITNPAVYTTALTLALVATLETLLNLDAVDQIDPKRRHSPPNRELLAQGVGNVVAGMIGGLPLTSVIVRSSVNINAGNETRLSAIMHGVLLLGSVLLIPDLINSIPLSALAAILLVTGFKLAKPAIFQQMWREGRTQFLPFITTVGLIVMTDLLTGVLLGLGIALAFILRSNLQRPMKVYREHRADGDVLRIELANQVSFLNRASLERVLRHVPDGGHAMLDAHQTDYIDPDILDLIHDFKDSTAPAHGVKVSLVGFKDEYPRLQDQLHFLDHATPELQASLTPEGVLSILKAGNERFLRGERLHRDARRQVQGTAPRQAPLAVVLGCIDSRAPAEQVFDLGIGDMFSVRVAGNVARSKVLGSVEYACKAAGAKLIVVMGHTRCGAVTAAVDLKHESRPASELTGCDHIDVLVEEIQLSIDDDEVIPTEPEARARHVDAVARRNVLHTIEILRTRSGTLAALLASGQVGIVGAMYDVSTGVVDFIDADGVPCAVPLPGEYGVPAS